VDFYCLEARLAVEIDGDSHVGREDYDRMRQALIESEGIMFIRIDADELIVSPESLVLRIRELITDSTPSPLVPLPEGEGKV
jgi:very-short-patch-repair endonuclease